MESTDLMKILDEVNRNAALLQIEFNFLRRKVKSLEERVPKIDYDLIDKLK